MDLPIGEEIARRRKQRGITQQELAVFMNVSKASVSKWERRLSNKNTKRSPRAGTKFYQTVLLLLPVLVTDGLLLLKSLGSFARCPCSR